VLVLLVGWLALRAPQRADPWLVTETSSARSPNCSRVADVNAIRRESQAFLAEVFRVKSHREPNSVEWILCSADRTLERVQTMTDQYFADLERSARTNIWRSAVTLPR
jgi:hypothetical protein